MKYIQLFSGIYNSHYGGISVFAVRLSGIKYIEGLWNMNEIFNAFLSELIDERISKLRIISKEYDERLRKKQCLSDEIEKIKKRLSDNDTSALESYISEIVMISDIECKFLLIQGFSAGAEFTEFFKSF